MSDYMSQTNSHIQLMLIYIHLRTTILPCLKTVIAEYEAAINSAIATALFSVIKDWLHDLTDHKRVDSI